MSENPCKNCGDRYRACWDFCPRYKAWRAERDRHIRRDIDHAIKAYTVNMIDKQKRKAHKRREGG